MKLWTTLSMASLGLLWGTYSPAQPIIKISNAKDASTVRKQVDWYLDYFDINENILVSVIFAEHMPDKMDGMTYCLDAAPPSDLLIKVRIAAHLSEKQRRLVLAHEMIHVKQYAKGELKVIGHRKVVWKGRSFRNHYTGSRQQLSPWEREAYRTDDAIANMCINQPDESLLVKNKRLDSADANAEKSSGGFKLGSPE